MKLGVIGSPIEHSRSPQIFEHFFRALDLNASFERVRVDALTWPDFCRAFTGQTFDAVSVTSPLKERVLADVTPSPRAKRLGAVNQIVQKDGALFGYNTDVYGVQKALSEHCEIKGKRAMIFGASGAARAALFALAEGGARDITIANRTLLNAQALVYDLQRYFSQVRVRASSLSRANAFLPECEIVVQATPVGLRSNESVIKNANFARGSVVLDMVYVPLESAFLSQAKAKDCVCINGLHMLVHQAAAQAERLGLGITDAIVREAYEKVRRTL